MPIAVITPYSNSIDIPTSYINYVNNTSLECIGTNIYPYQFNDSRSYLTDVKFIGCQSINMFHTFYNCYNLRNVSDTPNGVTNMVGTFHNCYNLIKPPNIPSNVTNMYGTFYNCTNLNGDINIFSPSITNISYCFYYKNPANRLNIYVPAGSNTNTKFYNSVDYSSMRFYNTTLTWKNDSINSCYYNSTYNFYVYYTL